MVLVRVAQSLHGHKQGSRKTVRVCHTPQERPANKRRSPRKAKYLNGDKDGSGLSEIENKFYTLQGGGNLSKGIRKYWRGLTKRAADKCPACAGSGWIRKGSIAQTHCFKCDGSGIRR